MGLASRFHSSSDVTHRRPPKLCTMFGHLRGWYTVKIYIFGLLPPDKFCPVQNSLHVQVMHSPVLAALLHCTPAVGVSQTLRHCTCTRNGIMELSQTAPPIFSWVAITLGISPHSSLLLNSTWNISEKWKVWNEELQKQFISLQHMQCTSTYTTKSTEFKNTWYIIKSNSDSISRNFLAASDLSNSKAIPCGRDAIMGLSVWLPLSLDLK